MERANFLIKQNNDNNTNERGGKQKNIIAIQEYQILFHLATEYFQVG